jgi:hypothetical protein
MADAELKGVKTVTEGLNKFLAAAEGNTHKGMLRGGAMMKRKARQLAPKDTGTMAASAFTQTEKRPGGSIQRNGYTVPYAAAIERLTGKLKGQPRAHFGKTRAGQKFGGGSGKGNYWDGGEIKPLMKTLTRNVKRYMDIVIRATKI